MPVPSGFDNKVVIVTGSPVDASDLNAELATQNTAGYWATNLTFVDNNTVAMLVAKNFATTYGFSAPQKVNLVAANQVDVDADAATELDDGNVPTGTFATPDGDLMVLYQLLIEPST